MAFANKMGYLHLVFFFLCKAPLLQSSVTVTRPLEFINMLLMCVVLKKLFIVENGCAAVEV